MHMIKAPSYIKTLQCSISLARHSAVLTCNWNRGFSSIALATYLQVYCTWLPHGILLYYRGQVAQAAVCSGISSIFGLSRKLLPIASTLHWSAVAARRVYVCAAVTCMPILSACCNDVETCCSAIVCISTAKQ